MPKVRNSGAIETKAQMHLTPQSGLLLESTLLFQNSTYAVLEQLWGPIDHGQEA